MGAGTGLLVAIGGSSLLCFWLVTRARRPSSDGGGSDSTLGSGSIASWSLFGWFGANNSSSSDTNSPSDTGSSHHGGGDSGGGYSGGGGD